MQMPTICALFAFMFPPITAVALDVGMRDDGADVGAQQHGELLQYAQGDGRSSTQSCCPAGYKKKNVVTETTSPRTWKLTCSAFLDGGEGFVKIGGWRFGIVDESHFSFSYGTTSAVIFRKDGTVHTGGVNHYALDQKVLLSTGSDVEVGDAFLEFDYPGGSWRLGEAAIDSQGRSHFSVSHKAGTTVTTSNIWRDDGTQHDGQFGFDTFDKALVPANVVVGEDFVQMGKWRIGVADQDESHFSIFSNEASGGTGWTARIYRNTPPYSHGGQWKNYQNYKVGTPVD